MDGPTRRFRWERQLLPVDLRRVAPENAGSITAYRAAQWSAGAHAGEEGSDGVRCVPVEVGLGHVVTDGGAWVAVAHRDLHVPDGDPGDQAGGAEGAAQ